MSVQKNYEEIINTIPSNVKLVAVSKTHPVEAIQEVYNMGQRVFGENKVQELVAKQPLLPGDIQWHLIGHLQSNKVKYVAEFVDTIESVDSEKLLEEINRQAAKHDRTIRVLLQVKIAEEDSKTGMEVSETKELFLKYLQGQFSNIEITGLMGIGTFTDDEEQTRREFLFLKRLFDQLSIQKKLETLSMGMSGDYLLAIACGSTSVRIGSSIFGARDYNI
ncbi:TPA: YggS family pyridoxal phosphate-dependent enzyme [Elizabethkingia meningoseptica]|uniref:YggS family pyridoxal phosphate-dependent enzyme n=1 Tax=Elizabethkingia meningoseptica TaxID=238 RepID=UPI0020117612|nr:YggS family pyridoxal phosphate-dependent enzyme [Elizabethkingia meningoseptica]EJK5328941.1 YggS family pyridoxal phosphate-dependent enzyme [Elizabethkingia meningoseptica]MCL1676098.1 YggS family pyridoxal phosphate-dependent enzyme [Elizabethkingia meningoseptica]MCL1684807.1 YggS family pyridoxal phosphate-dependent enzyme [Elizabethkingia meningoseptica]MDE5493719.1 YggS family pyridoxal phosphate-dependent enzyme [Elizabethkingia meningoseptica]WBS75130.1 YggS family pyridoxal phosp